MRVLMIGDVVGRPGRRILLHKLEEFKKDNNIDFVVANLENASGGNGITEHNLKELLKKPIDVVTMGNHTFNQKEAKDYIDNYPNMVRPINFPEGVPGRGFTVIEKDGKKIGVLNISGSTFMGDMDSPFGISEEIIDDLKDQVDILLIDFHGETTSEKIAYGYRYDGKATAIVGTHTHVQTADNRILPNGTAYITDLGMTGPLNGVIGTKKEIIIDKFLTKLPQKFEVELEFPWQLNGVIIDIDDETNKATNIERVYKIFEDQKEVYQ